MPPRDEDELVELLAEGRCLVCAQADADFLVTLPDGTSLLVCAVCRESTAVAGTLVTPMWRIDGGRP